MNLTVTLSDNQKAYLRWAEVGDARAIARLELDSGEYENRAFPFDLSEDQFTAVWQERLSGSDYPSMVICGANKLCGFLTFENEIQLGHVMALYIAPEYMRKGVGSILFDTALNLIRLKGGHYVKVDVEKENAVGQAFYRSFGLKKVCDINDHLILMRKELNHA